MLLSFSYAIYTLICSKIQSKTSPVCIKDAPSLSRPKTSIEKAACTYEYQLIPTHREPYSTYQRPDVEFNFADQTRSDIILNLFYAGSYL